MPSVINSDDGVVSGSAGLKTSGASDGLLDFQSNGTRIAGITTSAFQIGTNNISAVNSLGFRNRIINGDMRIDQRNAGASVSMASTAYPVDRWIAFEDTDGAMTAQRSTVAPEGFTNSVVITTTTADASLGASQYARFFQSIEGFNVADLGWGTANAKTVTLSFWVRSSLTGTFGGSVYNSAFNRSYPFTYSISSANTWEQKSVTISGDTSGTWLTDNGIGLGVNFGLGTGSTFSGTAGAWTGSGLLSATGAVSVVGTNGATFYITGVQLEAGSVATPFERRPYGTELMLCQRYLPAFNASGTSTSIISGYNESTTATRSFYQFIVAPRTPPTGISISAAGDFTVSYAGGSAVCTSLTFNSSNSQCALLIAGVASGLTTGQGNALRQTSTAGQILFTGCEL